MSHSRLLRDLGAMKNFGLWFTSMTLSYELKTLDFMNISRMWMT